MAADLVIQDEDPYPRSRPFEQDLLELAAELVVLEDEELYQHVFFGRRDALEDAAEGRLSINQQLDLIATQIRDLGEVLGRPTGRLLLTSGGAEMPGFLRSRPVDVADLVVSFLSRRDIPLEPAASEHPIRRHRYVGEGVERDDPGDRALRGPGAHHCVD